MITHARHRVHLEHALQFLEAFLTHGGNSIICLWEPTR